MNSMSSGEVVEGELVSTDLAPASPTVTARYELAQPAALVRPGEFVWTRDEIRDEWLKAKRLRTGSTDTVNAYARDIALYFEWCDARGLDVFQAFGPDVNTWTEALLNEDGVGYYGPATRARKTVARMVSAVSSFYKFAGQHSHGAIGNPVDYAQRVQATRASDPTSLDRDQLDRFLDAARSEGVKVYALMLLLAGTGLRVSEVCKAKVSDLTRFNGIPVIYVRRKGGERSRVRVPPAAERALHRYVRDRKGPLFLQENGKPMSRRTAAWHVEHVARTAFNLSPKDRCTTTPHTLRRTAATLALSAGIPVRDLQVQLGHSRSETTVGYDTEVREIENKAADFLSKLVEDA